MFNLSKINSPLNSSFEDPVFQNQRQNKRLEYKYHKDGMTKSLNYQMSKAEEQKTRKQIQSENFIRHRQELMNDMELNRSQKIKERSFLANQYEQMINNRKLREKNDKIHEKQYERNLLAQASWMRDANQEKELYKKKMSKYSQELERHVKKQQELKKQQIENERRMRDKINEEARQILEKQYKYLQESHKKKSLFQQRQNQILGIKNSESTLENSVEMPTPEQEKSLKKKEQQMYGLGLGLQVNETEKKKKKEIDHHFINGPSYNPITNPIPIVYKNPNIKKMMAFS